MSCSGFVTGGPEWLFLLVLGGGGIALLYGLGWVSLVRSQDRAPQPRRSPSRWWLVLALVPLCMSLPPMIADSPVMTAVIVLTAVVMAVPVVATPRSMARRAAVTGTFPGARSAPFGMFWVFIAITVLGLAVSVSSLTAMVELGHPTHDDRLCTDG
jgi:hypothetical protein